MKKRFLWSFMILMFTAVSVLCLCGCGNSAEPISVTSGRVSVDGSTSMEKCVCSLGEAYMISHPDVNFTFNPTGSGSGIVAVADGRCDIGLSSRALSEEEKSRGLIETVLAYDGIAVVVNPENPVEDLSLGQISDIYTGKITNWKDVGGKDADIVLVGREAASGTRSGFEEIVDVEGKCLYRQELTSSGDVMTSVSQNPDAIGYTSFASLNDEVKSIAVGGVIPSENTIRDGSFAIRRPFMLITSAERPLSVTAQAFFDYMTSDAAVDIIEHTGVVAAYR